MGTRGYRPGTDDRVCGRSRGQMETIGIILIFGMVIGGAVLVVGLGSQAISDTQGALSDQRAQKAMTQFDSKAALVALGNADLQQVQMPSRGHSDLEVDKDAGTMTIDVVNLTSGASTNVVETQMGELKYERDETILAYQGGGVWRKDTASNESVMVSPSEFHFRNGTLTLPVINISNDGTVGSSATVTTNGTDQRFPDSNAGSFFQNPIKNHKVKVTVESDYYKGWGRYFEERTDGEVTYNHTDNEVTLELLSPLGATKVRSATASLSASGSFILQGKAKTFCGNNNYVNSYNSSKSGDYCTQANAASTPASNPQPGVQGDIIYGKDIDIEYGAGTSNLYGNLESGRDVIVSGSNGGGQPDVYGNITYASDCIPQGGPASDCTPRIIKPGASVSQGNDITTAPQINSHLEDRVDNIDDNNDNTDSGVPISGDLINWAGSTVTLEEGTYYLNRLKIPSGDTLELEPNGGTLTIAVADDFHVENGGHVTISGSGIVKMYVGGEEGNESFADGWDMNLAKTTRVKTPDDDATQLRIYGKDDFQAQIGDGKGGPNLAKFVGVIYAPPGQVGSGKVEVTGGVVYGGILTGTTTLAKGSIHYDEALADKQIVSRGAKVVKVTYLHISENRIDIEK